jgi:hypothetical protein
MALIVKTLPGVYGGVSNQTESLRKDNQVTEMINCNPSLVSGTTRRPNVEYGVIDVPNDSSFIYDYSRDTGESHILSCNTLGELSAYTIGVGPATVTMEAGVAEYLTHTDNKDLNGITIGDTTFIVNSTKVVGSSFVPATSMPELDEMYRGMAGTSEMHSENIAYYWLSRSSNDEDHAYRYVVELDGVQYDADSDKSEYAARVIANKIMYQSEVCNITATKADEQDDFFDIEIRTGSDVGDGDLIDIDGFTWTSIDGIISEPDGDGALTWHRNDVGKYTVTVNTANAEEPIAYILNIGEQEFSVVVEATTKAVADNFTSQLNEFVAALVTPTRNTNGFSTEASGSIVRIWKDDYSSFTFNYWDSWGSLASFGWKYDVPKLQDLPSSFPWDGAVARINSSDGYSGSDYYVMRWKGTWQEFTNVAEYDTKFTGGAIEESSSDFITLNTTTVKQVEYAKDNGDGTITTTVMDTVDGVKGITSILDFIRSYGDTATLILRLFKGIDGNTYFGFSNKYNIEKFKFTFDDDSVFELYSIDDTYDNYIEIESNDYPSIRLLKLLNNMPIVVERLSDGTFLARLLKTSDGLKPPIVGNDDNNKDPYFVGKTIQQLFYINDRLCIVSGDSLTFSEVGILWNYYITSIVNLLDGDSLEVKIASERVLEILKVAIFQSGLLIMTSEGQYIFNTELGISPATAFVNKLSNYSYNNDGGTIYDGDSIVFSGKTGDTARLYRYRVARLTSENKAIDLTIQVPTYIQGTVQQIVNYVEDGTLIVRVDDSKKLYLYREVISGDQMVQSSWYSWDFSNILTNAIIHIMVIDDYLYFISVDGVYKIPLGIKVFEDTFQHMDLGTTPYESKIELTRWRPKKTTAQVQTSRGRVQLRTLGVSLEGKASLSIFKEDRGLTISKDLTNRRQVNVLSDTNRTILSIVNNENNPFTISAITMSGTYRDKGKETI